MKPWIIQRIRLMDQTRYDLKVSRDGEWLYAFDAEMEDGTDRHCEDRGKGWRLTTIAPEWTLDVPWYGDLPSNEFSEEEIEKALELINEEHQ